MKIQLNSILLILLIFNQSFSFSNPDNIYDSTKTTTCVFYLEQENELMDSMMIIFDINEFFYSDLQGKIVLNNVKPGHHSLICEKNNTVIIIDSIFLDSTINRIRLYDYMFEPYKQLIDWAKEDIQSKNIKILLAGMPLLFKDKSELEKRKENFEKKYGIYFQYHSCDPSNQWLYNYKIFNYLDILNGNEWRKDYDNIWKRN